MGQIQTSLTERQKSEILYFRYFVETDGVMEERDVLVSLLREKLLPKLNF